MSETVILPLYSNKGVSKKSGLNQWNGHRQGDKRDKDEAYIHHPAYVRKNYPDFFPSKEHKFDLELPSGAIISAKVCQQGGKAIMSDPNKDLGKWILRDELELEPGTLCTMKILKNKNIDSVEITKVSNDSYKIKTMPFDSYKKFEKMK